MPDVSRSDSNRSDASRPRVSFNRDVHVKRINGPRTANAYSLSADGTSFIPTAIRRERPMTKKEMTKEAEVVLKQVDKVSCTATSNAPNKEKPKEKKKRKDSFSFLKKSEKQEKTNKNSSSDVDSGSSQEYRIYRVNSTLNNNNNSNHSGHNSHINSNNKINLNDGTEYNKNKKKIYDFMSLDRKRLKAEKKNKHLDYLSLERNNEILEKMKKEKYNKMLISKVFDKMDGKSKKTASPGPPPEVKENAKSKPKIVLEVPSEKFSNKKQLSPIMESPVVEYTKKKAENNIDKMIKKLTEKNIGKLTKNTETNGIKEPQNDMSHNDNQPFSYTSGDRKDLGVKSDLSESLGDGKEDLRFGSPTSDVIYAQVIVGGRDGNVQKTTVNERIASNEVGRVFVGEKSNQSQVGLNYKIDTNQNDEICESVTVNGENMWSNESDYRDRKKERQNIKLTTMEFQEDTSRRFQSGERESASNNPIRDDYAGVIRTASKYDTIKRTDRSPTDLHDLSIRREILLSRSESQAKERFNSLKRLKESTIKRQVSNVNGIKPGDRILKSEIQYPEPTITNEKFAAGHGKSPREPEKETPTEKKKGRQSNVETYLKQKHDNLRNSDKVHLIVTDDDDNLLQKLTKFGKSKSFVQEKGKSKKMEKVKLLFKKKKEGKSSESEDDPLASRYIEYRGSDIELTSDRSRDSSPKRTLFKSEIKPLESHSARKSFQTPISYDSIGTLTRVKNDKNKNAHWLKPLNKTGKKEKQKRKLEDIGSENTTYFRPPNLRFFGDTDQESTTNDNNPPDLKGKYGSGRPEKITDSDEDLLIIPKRPESRMTNSTLKSSTVKHKSKYDLDRSDYGLKQMNHTLNFNSNKYENMSSNLNESSILSDTYDFNGLKYGPEVMRNPSTVTNSTKYGTKEKLRNLKSTPATTISKPEEPFYRRVLSHGNLYSQEEKKGGRRRIYDSSAESATEGDSSQHSTKSMIYLHAATVGDIPGPRNIYKSEKRSQSREELSSAEESVIMAQGKKTLSRSISVLAPWRPKHNKEDRTLHYDSVDFSNGKPPTGSGKSKRSSSREGKPGELRFNTIGKENRRRKDLLR